MVNNYQLMNEYFEHKYNTQIIQTSKGYAEASLQ